VRQTRSESDILGSPPFLSLFPVPSHKVGNIPLENQAVRCESFIWNMDRKFSVSSLFHSVFFFFFLFGFKIVHRLFPRLHHHGQH